MSTLTLQRIDRSLASLGESGVDALLANATLIQYCVQEMFKGRQIPNIAKNVAKKFSGSENMFLGQGVLIIDAKELEAALWKYVGKVAADFAGKVKPGKEHFAIDGTVQQFRIDVKYRARVKTAAIDALGRDVFTNDDANEAKLKVGQPIEIPKYDAMSGRKNYGSGSGEIVRLTPKYVVIRQKNDKLTAQMFGPTTDVTVPRAYFTESRADEAGPRFKLTLDMLKGDASSIVALAKQAHGKAALAAMRGVNIANFAKKNGLNRYRDMTAYTDAMRRLSDEERDTNTAKLDAIIKSDKTLAKLVAAVDADKPSGAWKPTAHGQWQTWGDLPGIGKKQGWNVTITKGEYPNTATTVVLRHPRSKIMLWAGKGLSTFFVNFAESDFKADWMNESAVAWRHEFDDGFIRVLGIDEMAATYVPITRDEFEGWLSEVWGTGNWNIRAGSVGVYRLKLGAKVSLEVSSSIGRADTNMGVGEGAIHVAMVARESGKTLNRKATGKSRVNRTKGWRGNLLAALKALEAEYTARPYFYDAIADPAGYKTQVIAQIEAVPGWDANDFFKSIHGQVSQGRVLSDAQRAYAEDLARRMTK